jgi:hypothetical protein
MIFACDLESRLNRDQNHAQLVQQTLLADLYASGAPLQVLFVPEIRDGRLA